MKKLITLLLITISFHQLASAQWTTSGTNAYFNLTGNVGIGTTTPQTKLHVVGNEIRLTGVGSSGSASLAFISFYDSNNTTRYGFIGDASAGSSDIYLNTGAGGSLRFGTNGLNDQMFINTLGNVGIGDTNPSYKLTVNSQNNTSSAAALLHGGYYGISVSSEQSTSAYYVLNVVGGTSSSGGGGTSLLYARADGNIGIGTTTPDQKLSVNGTIHSKSVLVDLSGWADYVFKSDYSIRTLTDVKKYIDQNHHLPEMPSEEEIKKTGLNLGEINQLLTKKVEELTLYLIEQAQTEKQQQEKIAAQEERIDKLEKAMEQVLDHK